MEPRLAIGIGDSIDRTQTAHVHWNVHAWYLEGITTSITMARSPSVDGNEDETHAPFFPVELTTHPPDCFLLSPHLLSTRLYTLTLSFFLFFSHFTHFFTLIHIFQPFFTSPNDPYAP